MLKKLTHTQKPYQKKNFSPSDFDKWSLELYFALKGVPQTNPMDVTGLIRTTTGSAIEDAVLELYRSNGLVDEYYDQDFDGRIEMEREGVKVTGYIDALTQKNNHGLNPGSPVEIKSINNNNKWDVSDYQQGKPRFNYVGQLAVYMDYLEKDIGYLQVITIDGLTDFFYECHHEGGGVYRCGNTVVNVTKEYQRWSNIQRMVEEGTIPDLYQYRYKYPLKEVDWKSLSPYKISKARNGVVIGDWQVTYSPYKDLIIKMQGDTLGYSDEELEYIKEQTKGYTTWNKK